MLLTITKNNKHIMIEWSLITVGILNVNLHKTLKIVLKSSNLINFSCTNNFTKCKYLYN